MRGRKPKPTALHVLQGTLNPTRHKARKKEVQPRGEPAAEPPDWMSDSQKAGWRYAIQHAPANVLKAVDLSVLAVWVVAEDQHRVAAAMQTRLDTGSNLPLLSKKGKGDAAEIIVSPYLGIMNRAAAVLLKAASELGFTPASRPRLGAADQPAEAGLPSDPWTRLRMLQGGKAAG